MGYKNTEINDNNDTVITLTLNERAIRTDQIIKRHTLEKPGMHCLLPPRLTISTLNNEISDYEAAGLGLYTSPSKPSDWSIKVVEAL